MANNQQPITGNRELTQEEIDLINMVKAAAAQIGHLVDLVTRQDFVDARWAAIARADLQKAFMALVRAVAKPESF